MEKGPGRARTFIIVWSIFDVALVLCRHFDHPHNFITSRNALVTSTLITENTTQPGYKNRL